MEVWTGFEQPLPSQSSLSQNPSDASQKKNKSNFWIILVIVALTILTCAIIFYLFQTGTLKNVFVDQPPQPSATLLIDQSATVNQIRFGPLQLAYPQNWIPIYTTSSGQISIYFADSLASAQNLLTCANRGTCNNYPLKLEGFVNTFFLLNYTTDTYIKEYKPEIDLTPLGKTILSGREAWLGYMDSTKLSHRLVINTTIPGANYYITVLATTSETDRQMLEEYVSLVPNLTITEYRELEPSELLTMPIKKVFVAEFSSDLVSQEYPLLSLITQTMLTSSDLPQNYHYHLFTDTVKAKGAIPGGPDFPEPNYLNATYYLLTDNDHLEAGIYKTPQLEIKLSLSSLENLDSYLADPKYCVQDSDCQYRTNFCTIGAYNTYHQVTSLWECGPIDIENIGNTEALQSKLGCQTMGAKFDALKCLNHSCHMVNTQAICQ